MKLLCGCGNLVLPAGKLLNSTISCGTAQAIRRCRHLHSDQHASDYRKRRLSAECAAVADHAVNAQPTSVEVQQYRPSFRAFLDFKALKADLDNHVQNCKNRHSNANPAKVADLYDEFCEAQQQVDSVREDRNSNAKAMKGKLDPDKRKSLIQQGKDLKDSLAVLEAKLEALQDSLQHEGQLLPNLAHPSVPIGDEEAAAVVAVVGSPQEFDFKIRDHVQLGQELDCIDFDTAAEVSGSKFVYLRRAAALLELALVNYAMQKVVSRGFVPIMTPDLVKESVLEKCGFQPRGTATQVYSVQDSPLCLTGTAEIPLGAVYMDQILSEDELPIKMAGFGHCFRTEAGAGGSASRGLYRVHQFSKVEMFVVCTPQQSEALLEDLADIEKDMFTELGLHFKILDMPTGDLGAPAHRKYDVEAWMPGVQRYGEISSASNCTDYQSRRLNIRYRPKTVDISDSAGSNGNKQKAKKVPTEFVHTLNATACAVPRMIVAIFENFQQADGSVIIPEALRPYMGNMSVITSP
ncbi:hypothetical protein ABBQ32_004864 [Trebouxia sp. C0010 RCD-2024]